MTIIDFAIKFNVMSDDMWKLALEALDDDKVIKDLKPGKVIHLLNVLKDLFILTNTLLVRLIEQLTKKKNLELLRIDDIPVLMIILRSDHIEYSIKSSDKYIDIKGKFKQIETILNRAVRENDINCQ